MVSGTTESVLMAVYSSVGFSLFYIAAFMFGTLVSIIVLPKIPQVIISQLLFISIAHVFSIYMGASDIDIMSMIIQLFFIANAGSILLVVLVKFAYEIYAWCVYRLQGK